MIIVFHCIRQACVNTPKRSDILEPQDPGSYGILDLMFSFSHGILEILDPVTAALPGILEILDIGDKIFLLDSVDPGSSLSKSSCDLAGIGSYTTKCRCILNIFTFNEILLLVSHIYALLKTEHC